MKRRLSIILLGLGLTVLVAFAAMLWALSQGWQRDWIREQLEIQLATALDKPVAIGALEGVLYRDWILSKIRIGEPETPLAEIETLAFDLGWLRFVGTPRLTIDHMRLERVRLDWPRIAESNWPWEDASEDQRGERAEGKGPSLHLRARTAVLEDVSIRLGPVGEEETLLNLGGVLREVELAQEVSVREVEASLALTNAAAEAQPWLSGQAQGGYAAGTWRLTKLELGGPVLSLQAQGRGDASVIRELSISLDVPSIREMRARVTGEASGLDGVLQVQADLEGAYSWPRVMAVVEAGPLVLDGRPLPEISMKLRSETHGSFALDDLQLTRPSRGRSGGGNPSGPTPGQAAGDSQAKRIALLTGSAHGSLRDGKWQIDDLRLTGPLLDLEGQGRGDPAQIQAARFSLRVPSIKALAAEIQEDSREVSGSLELTAELAGKIQWPRTKASLIARDVLVEGKALGDIRVEGRSSAPGQIELDAVQYKNGWVDLAGGAGSQVTSSAQGTRIEALRLQNAGAGGSLNIQASLPSTGGFDFEAISLSPETRLSVEAEDWSLVILQPLWSALGVSADGRIDVRLAVSGAPKGLQVEGTAAVHRARASAEAGRIEGADLELSLAGQLDAPTIDFSASVDRIDLGSTALRELVTKGSIRDRLVTFDRFSLRDDFARVEIVEGARVAFEDSGRIRFDELTIQEGSQTITFRGALDADSAEDFRVEIAQLDMARMVEWGRALGRLPAGPPVSGQLNGDLRWHGLRSYPELRGELAWSDPVLGDLAFEGVGAKLETAEASIVVTNDWRRRGVVRLGIVGRVPRDRVLIEPDDLLRDSRTQVDATMSDFDLSALAPFLPPSVSHVAGFLTAEATITGGNPEPRITGLADLRAGVVKLPGLGGQTFEPIQGHATLNGDRVSLDLFRIGRPESGVEGRGEFSFDGQGPRSLESDFDFTEFPLDITGLVRGVVSGRVAVSGELDALDLTGRIALSGVRAQIPEPEASILREIRITTSDGDVNAELTEDDSSLALLRNLRIDLQVELSRNSWARGRGAEIELRGNIEAEKKRQGELSLSGTIETVRGTYEVYGRRFRVERGEVTLDGGTEVDPVLDVRAVHRVRDVRIYAIIEGRLSEPLLRFESVPDLDETDIASYLLFGRPMAGSAGEEQVALDAVAAQIATGAALREFERMFGGALPVDLIDLRVESNGQASAVHAGVGKYVGDRLFLYYERGFGDVPTDELKAEYELTPNWSVESTVTGDGETAGDIVFEIEY